VPALLEDASLWQAEGPSVRQVAVVAAASDFATSAETRASLEHAFRASSLVVGALFQRRRERLSYAFASPDRRFAIYAEQNVPADRKSAFANNSAFSDLYYAIYLGDSERPAALLTTSFSRLPPTGQTARVAVPFGSSTLTFITAPRGEPGGALPARLPWVFAILGCLLSIAAAWTTEHLVRRRRSAERDAAQIRRLFAEQRAIAETLQRALLPRETPRIAGMEAAVRYLPGAKGMEIGGDWYSIIPVDDERFAFVVGDVSGRGLGAATVMAALRFTIRTYAFEGNSPSVILEKCSKQLDVLADGHFATVLVGVGDVARREVTLANAGHLNPLVVDDQGASYVETAVGVPLGVSGGIYEAVTVSLRPGTTLIAFTDGLVEKRTESLDVGLKKLEEVAGREQGPLDLLLAKLVIELTDETSEDDIAMLGLRWQS